MLDTNLNLFIMKKAIFCAAALMFGAIGFAQNTSDVSQEGNDNDAGVTQSGSNTSMITQGVSGQKGYSNFATVDQTGASTSEIEQYDGRDGENRNNEATVTQVGDGHYSMVKQLDDDNIAFVDQNRGIDNDSDVYQVGSSNYADVDQEGDENMSDIDQAGDAGAIEPNNEAFVLQEGYKNSSTIIQDNTLNDANVHQLGDENTAVVEQANIPPGGTIAKKISCAYFRRDDRHILIFCLSLPVLTSVGFAEGHPIPGVNG